AGGVLACSATGSQLMPPVMGAAAFMMATFIGQPYAVVMLAGILPAVLFYFAVTLGVQFLSVRKDLRTVRLDVDWALIRRRLPVFALPIGLIFVMLLMRYSPANTAFWAGVITLATGFAIKDTRPTCKELINSLVSGAVTGAKIGISLALIGMVAQTLISTGLGGKLASLIHTLAGGQLLPALLVTMVVALILGCAVPPAAAYALCAIIIIPTLTPMGVDLLRAHMFCFYFSIIAAVTPPVGLASLAATGISGGHYGVTSVHGFRLSLSGFVLPFLIIYNPLFSYDFSNAVWSVCSLICILTGLTALNALLYGAMARPFKAHDYALSGVVMLLSLWLTACGGSLTPATVIAGTAVAVALLIFQWRRQAAQPLTVARSDDAHGTKA
ncbi:MAG: TRAP transporter large permease subunit, partial [Desulfovibrionaceae bacterium]|nr:TRAP transporter large permease subunit [Desulfovibrionaceae bacterium]